MLAKEKRVGIPIEIGMLGGHVDRGETPLHAAKRELLEESGYVSERWKLMDVLEHSNVTVEQKNYFFAAANCRKVSKRHLDEGEIIRLVKVDFKKLLSFSSNQGIFNKYLGGYMSKISSSKKSTAELRDALFKNR